MSQLMSAGGMERPPGAGTPAADGAGAGAGSSGFRFVRLPGGFAATYSSGGGTGSARVHSHMQAVGGSPFAGGGAPPPAAPHDDVFASAFGMGGGVGGFSGGDLLEQLLLAGARSALQRQRSGVAADAAATASGFATFDPEASSASNTVGGSIGGMTHAVPPGGGLEALLGALFGGGMASAGADAAGSGGLTYEQLMGLRPVAVPTPPDVLASLPRSRFVEGRTPGDRWECVACCCHVALMLLQRRCCCATLLPPVLDAVVPAQAVCLHPTHPNLCCAALRCAVLRCAVHPVFVSHRVLSSAHTPCPHPSALQ
jgi:hypothetical protein